MTLRGVVVSADGRLRAPWRILVFLSIAVGLFVATSVLLGPALAAAARITGLDETSDALAVAIALVATHAIMIKAIDRRGWSYAWLDRGAARPGTIGFGLVLGAVPITLASLGLLALGWLAVEPGGSDPWLAAAAKMTVVLLLAAFYEELLSRGYLLAAMADLMGMRAAVVVTSITFGLLHLGNPGVSAQPIILVTLAGVFLSVVLLATKSLYAAWSAHFAWNWVMAVPLHVSVSGLVVLQPRYQTVDAGPDWATGGAWGPEGGAFAGATMLAGMGYLYFRRMRQRDI